MQDASQALSAEPSVAGFDSELRGADLWLRLVHEAIGLFRVQAFHHVSLRQLAERAGLDEEKVREQFPTVDDLAIAVLQVWNAERMTPLMPVANASGAVVFLRGIVQANIADPSLMRFLTGTVTIAATPKHPMAPVLQDMWLGFHALVQRALVHDIAVGREPDTMQPARGAEQLIALYEGLQLQFMLRPRMNLLEAFDRAVTRLRDGWARPYEPVAWSI